MINTIKEVYSYRYMLLSYSRSEVRNKYKGSILGIFWTLLNPVFMLIIYGFVFSLVMRIDIDNYFLYLFTGLLAWFFFRSAVLTSANSIIGNASLIKKIYFPREILPISTVLTCLINYLLGLVILIPALFIFGMGLTWHAIFFPVVVILQVFLTIGISLLVASLTVYFRDLRQILELAMMAGFYLTPILYRVDMVPEKFRIFINLNPLKPLIESYQNVLFFGLPPSYDGLLYTFVCSIVLLIVGMLVFKRLNKGFAEQI